MPPTHRDPDFGRLARARADAVEAVTVVGLANEIQRGLDHEVANAAVLPARSGSISCEGNDIFQIEELTLLPAHKRPQKLQVLVQTHVTRPRLLAVLRSVPGSRVRASTSNVSPGCHPQRR